MNRPNEDRIGSRPRLQETFTPGKQKLHKRTDQVAERNVRERAALSRLTPCVVTHEADGYDNNSLGGGRLRSRARNLGHAGTCHKPVLGFSAGGTPRQDLSNGEQDHTRNRHRQRSVWREPCSCIWKCSGFGDAQKSKCLAAAWHQRLLAKASRPIVGAMEDVMSSKPAGGLHGEDKRQGDLRDTQGGTYGISPASGNRPPVEEKRTAHQDAQPGADVRPEPVGLSEDDLPAGLKQQRKGPLNQSSGRR